MARPGLIDRQGILQWADSLVARSELPRLIRRLILETGRGVVQLGFPAGEGVAAGSWDGTVRSTADGPYVPLGLSLWELSVEKSAGAKADSDYAKRETAPDGSSASECTYVAVSLRPWTKRADWVRVRAAERKWNDVRALAVDDIEAWLEVAPVSHAWLSELVGLHPHGLVTAQTWWDTWSSATTPAFPRAAVVAGREAAVTALTSELSRPGQLVTIRGSSRDEVVAVVASIAIGEEQTDGGALLARTAFVDSVETWRRLRDHQTPLVLVALTDEVAREFAPGSPHVLIVPLSGSTDADIELPLIDSLAAAEVLKGEGLPDRLADEAGRLARLSLLAARRRLANKRELLRPGWAQAPVGRTARRVVLLGRWHERSEADLALAEKAVGVPYDSLREEVAALAAGGDPLLASIAGAVGVVSPFDAWLLLRGELRTDDLEAFHIAVRTVLTELDPRLELPREDRWRATMLGKVRAYSSDLRHGLATTLALLGAFGERPVAGAGFTGREWAARIIREVLEAANGDATCRLWASLVDVLPLLAEAAPTVFLDAVRTGAGGDSPVLRGLFDDATNSGGGLASESAHSSLLWSLEKCAWSPDHFGMVVDLLARLAEQDRGGKVNHRPFGSLRAILLPWFPQNAVSPSRRLAAIDGLRGRHQEVAWTLLLSLLPEPHPIAMSISEPRFRDWKPEKVAVTSQEYWSFIDAICSRVLDDVGDDPERWVALIQKIDALSPQPRAKVLARLAEGGDEHGMSARLRTTVWEALRAKAAQHREFADAAWALPSEEVAAIEGTATRFEPTDPVDRYGWLFRDHAPAIAGVRRGGDFAAYDVALTKARSEAAAEIAAANGWAGIRRFALSTTFPGLVGIALAHARLHEHDGEFLRLLESADLREVGFAVGYFSQRFRDQGWDWLEGCLRRGQLSPTQMARLLLCTDEFPKAWEVAQDLGESVVAVFWRNFRFIGLGAAFAHVDLAAEQLLSVDRPGDALNLIALYTRAEDIISPTRAELVARGLDALLEGGHGDTQVAHPSHYDIVQLFSALERSALPRDRLARLEWAYLPAFGIDSQPPTLIQMLSQLPDLFVDLIRRICRPSDRDGPECSESAADAATSAAGDEQREAIATNAYHLLSSWKTIPGLQVDGSVDGDALAGWVHGARAMLRESGHLTVGDTHIGQVLAWSPSDGDGVRPCREVRDLLETLQCADIEDGLRVALYNSRGPTSRGVFDSGDQERAVAAGYTEQAKLVADQWPRTAALLRTLSESYEQAARMMDDEAERRRGGFGD